MRDATAIAEQLGGDKGQRSRPGYIVQPLTNRWTTFRHNYSWLISLCDQAIVSVTSFLTSIVLGRVCGKVELGLYTLAWTLISVATGIFATLITSPYTVFAPRMNPARRRSYLGSILVHQVLLSLLAASLLLAGVAIASAGGWLSNGIASVITTGAGAILFVSLREFIRNVSFADQKIGSALLIDLTASGIQCAGLLILVRYEGLTAARGLALLGAASAVAVGGWLVLCRGAFRGDRRLFFPHLKRNWAFAKWVLGSGLLWHCAGYMFPWLLTAFHGPAVTGTWAACLAVVGLGNPALLGLSNYVLPRIPNVHATEGVLKMRRYVHRCSLMFAAVLIPVVLVVAAFGENILTAIYGHAYTGTGLVLTLLAANLLLLTMARPWAQGLFSIDCAKADTLVNLIWVSVLFASGIPAIKWYGASGAAATMFASSGIAAAIKLRVFTRHVSRRS